MQLLLPAATLGLGLRAVVRIQCGLVSGVGARPRANSRARLSFTSGDPREVLGQRPALGDSAGLTPGLPLGSLGDSAGLTLGLPLGSLGDSAVCDTGVAPQVPGESAMQGTQVQSPGREDPLEKR